MSAIAFEVGTAWLFKCDQCGGEYLLKLTAMAPRAVGGWLFADCCPFCHNRDVKGLTPVEGAQL